jgi:hypothetical protein
MLFWSMVNLFLVVSIEMFDDIPGCFNGILSEHGADCVRSLAEF